jgi:hypothetical protein
MCAATDWRPGPFQEGDTFMAAKKSMLAQQASELGEAVTRLFSGEAPAAPAKKKRRRKAKRAKATTKRAVKRVARNVKKTARKAKRKTKKR